MPETFLELAIPTRDLVESLAFYEALGFVQAPVGEAWPHPYAVVTDGRMHLGLHGVEFEGPLLTFVSPGLRARLAELEEAGVEFEEMRLDELSLNEAVFRDAAGQRVRLLEARTFSPPALDPGHESRLGYCEDWLVECARPSATAASWERFGFVAFADEETPDRALASSRSLNLAFRDAPLGSPYLRFTSPDVDARIETLRERHGCTFARVPRALEREASAVLCAPDGLRFLLSRAEG